MIIVLVNYRYFISGGPERYYFNIKEILEKNGHKVIPFSIKNSRNFDTEYEEYFLDAIDDEVYFANEKKSIGKMIKSFTRMFYSLEAKRKFKRLLVDTQPDVVYIMQYHNKISPSIINAACEMHIPVVHRISDFQYMCPNALFYNNKKGVCEDCLNGHYMSCIKNKCVLDSKIYSTIKLGAKILHDRIHIKDKISAFVVPSSFTITKLEKYGIPHEKLNHIPTFFNIKEVNPEVEYKPFVLYIGRIVQQKGVKTLIDAFVDTDMNLKIIGFSDNGYEDELKNYLKDKKNNIDFLGKMRFEEIVSYLKTCLCTVVPSEWYDNFPNVILESFAYKKAVIATNFGSLPELVKDGYTGYTFEYADKNDLKSKVELLMSNPNEARLLGENGYSLIETKYSPNTHYNNLINLFKKIKNCE